MSGRRDRTGETKICTSAIDLKEKENIVMIGFCPCQLYLTLNISCEKDW